MGNVCLNSEERELTWGYGQMGLLFMHGPEDYRRPPAADRYLTRSKHQQHPDKADSVVVAAFLQLQSIRRQQGTHREEREAWKRLIRYLTKLPPPGN
jgi:hypothetical protein